MMKTRLDECRSAAVTLSDMEIFVFPELMYSLVLANILSPRIWAWRDDPWFDGFESMRPYKRVQRLKQFIMDHYVFNLDLETWGLTRQIRELDRFRSFLSPEEIARSNALFGYQGDSYYFDIGIRRHFGLDKYGPDVIPYWKTETVEAMDAFRYKAGFSTGAGECVSLAALYAAALFLVARFPLEDIFLMATPLHSQNFLLLDDGILTNNRRIVTKTMWFNGTQISAQTRRALENENVTIVSHSTGWIHTLYRDATIDPDAYARFSGRLTAFLAEDPASAAAQGRAPDVTVPKLPAAATKRFAPEGEPIGLTTEMNRDEMWARLLALRSTNPTVDLAFYALRDLARTEAAPFCKAAIERNPVCVAGAEGMDTRRLLRTLAAWPGDSIYDGPGRVAQPDEVWNYKRGDGLEKALTVASILLARTGGEATLRIADGIAVLEQGGRTVCSFPSAKTPRETVWPLRGEKK